VVVNPRSYKLAITGILIMLAAGCGGGTGASLSITSSVAPSPSSTISERPTPRLTATLTAAPSPLPPTPVPPTPPAQPVTLPPAGSPALVIRKGDASRKIVAFSFDAGADAGFAAQILDTLAADGIHASFGMTGRWAERNPELLRRIVREGHQLINHTYDHASMTGAATKTAPQTREQRWEELDRTENIVMQLTGATTKPYFRPPYGAYDASVNEDVGARGYAYNVLWTVDSRGWMGWSAGAIIQRCLEQAEPGAIYVFHVGSGSQDGPALQVIIDGLRAQGYFIGSVPDVLPR
ncbi:MAG: polysaccharide deacetylase family protein, partial [Chloroflexi bacterium]